MLSMNEQTMERIGTLHLPCCMPEPANKDSRSVTQQWVMGSC
jgi:hypothetical protein